MRKQIEFLAAYFSLNLASAMEYRVTFISQMIGMALNDGIMIVFWWLFFRRFPEVGGWQLADVLRLWAVLATGLGLGAAIFGNVSRLPTLIANGQLDYYLALPKHPLLHLLISRMSIAGWGDVLFGVVAFIAVSDWRAESVLLFLTLVATTCVIFVAYGVLVGSLAFWTGNAEAVGTQAQNALIHFATYPGSVFRGWVKVLTFTLVPAAMVGHVPAELLRQFDPLVFAGVVGFGVVATALAVGAFSLGLRRYESGNRVNLRA